MASKGLKAANNTELPSLFQLSVSLFSLSYSLQFLISLSFTSPLATQPSLLARACPIASRRLMKDTCSLHSALSDLIASVCVIRRLLKTVV